MEQQINSSEILKRLAILQREINYLRECVEDKSLTKDDIEAIIQAREDLKNGKTRTI